MNARAAPVEEPGDAPPAATVEIRDGRIVDASASKLLIAILSCDKHQVRADGQRETWLRLLPEGCRALFVHGRPGQPPGIEGDRLYVDCPEAYEHLPEKVHRLLVYARDQLDFEYLFKTDDDTYLDLQRFLAFDREGADYIGRFRETELKEIGKAWHFGKCTDKSYEVPYARPFVCPWATGGGYFLSRRAVERAAQRTESTYALNLYEDVMVGEALTEDPELQVKRILFSQIGAINPLLAKDMHSVQEMLLEKWRLEAEVLRRRERAALARASATPA
jgi:hypothetical protein